MGRDKATIPVEGSTLAAHVARALTQAAYPVLTVGPAADTGLPAIDDSREGPLAALVTGGAALRARAHAGPFLVVACDLPNITADLLRQIAGALGDADVALPVVDGLEQPLCACYSQRAIDVGARVRALGDRSMRALIAALEVRRIDLSGSAQAFEDVDTPEDLKRILPGAE